jgi:HD-like signal output (HDOD) protein
VGRLIIFMKLPEQAAAILEQARKNSLVLHQVEKEHLGFDHADVGGALLRQWQLPDHLVDAVACHHRPARSTRFLDASLVHIADIVANAMQMGGSGGQVIPPMDAAVWEQLELSESILAPTLSQLERQYNDAVRFILPDEA